MFIDTNLLIRARFGSRRAVEFTVSQTVKNAAINIGKNR